jgi:hypothetical protein
LRCHFRYFIILDSPYKREHSDEGRLERLRTGAARAACKTACRSCETAINFFEWGNPDYNPGLYGDAAAAAGNTATATAAVLEAAGVDKLSCVGIMKCMATTLASTSLASAGTVVEWGQLSWTSDMDPADRQAAENEGIRTILTSGRGFLIETHAGTVFWAGIGAGPDTNQGPSSQQLLQMQGGIQVGCATQYSTLVRTNNNNILIWGSTGHGNSMPSSTRTALEQQGMDKCWATAVHYLVLSSTGQLFEWGCENYIGRLAVIPTDVETMLETEGVAKVFSRAHPFFLVI